MDRDTFARALKDQLGESLSDPEEAATELRMMAAYKFDEYDGYLPGHRFAESLLAWLSNLRREDRAPALELVRRRLVFISHAEMMHAVSRVYPSIVRRMLLRLTSDRTGIPWYRTADLASCATFRALERSTIVVGLSDGARIDALRRLSPGLDADHFLSAPSVAVSRMIELQDTLARAPDVIAAGAKPEFALVLLVDDFSATGTTLLRPEMGGWRGRLCDAHAMLREWQDRGLLAAGHHVGLVLYVATNRSAGRLGGLLRSAGLSWSIDVVQRIDEGARVGPDGDGCIYQLCSDYGDPTPVAYVPEGNGLLAYGCGGAGLLVILAHNTPDNSVSILWKDTPVAPGGWRAPPLFPRSGRYP